MQHKKFPTVDTQKSFDQMEQDVLKFWENHKIFEQSIASRDPKNEYTFYDGPPFATGMPHYGHFLASIIKDVVPRYFTMKGHRVERRFGWDCHGLPIENIVEGELETKSKKDIEDKVGVGKFNEMCRSKVQLYVDEWEKIITRLGRWVDFENDYKTMDLDFMESVMWLFAELHKKGLIYEGRRISLYCPRCATPLSNFEIAMDNSYQMRHDQTATVKFKLLEEENTYILAWTTTPWTLPSNFALAVNPDLEYVKVKKDETILIVAKDLAEKIFGEDVEIIETFKGSDLEGKKYEPLFPYFAGQEKLHEVRCADFVTAEDGTGIVHLAPYGEDDFNLAKEKGINIIDLETVDDGGNFKDIVTDFAGMAVMDKETNKIVNQYLSDKELLFENKQYSHNYPHCWRCETPLFYNPQRAYFLDVQKIKPNMLKNNEAINWEPNHLKEGRFQKGLETAPDWNLSRNRFWGSPIPIWKCENEDCDHQDVVGSIEELEKFSGEKVTDLHKHFVDKYTWKCSKCGGTMKRTEEVLDCWFESGAMPYAQKHFPFENKDNFKNNFPGDFIAEYIAQTRGWFYTLHVLSTALMDSHAFKNVICTGTILAEDGNKMSKSKKNYPDPTIMFEKYGSDAMRYYLMASSVMKGENFNFSEKGVEEILKTIILPIRNAYQFFQLYANIDGWKPTKFSFVRHGEADHNLAGIYSGNIENQHHLTETGQQQAKAAAEKIGDFDALYYSPFVRTTETAQAILKNAEIEGVQDERLREVDFGILEGQKYIPIIERLKHETGEHLNDIQDRMREAVREYGEKHRGQHVVIVSHGGPIRYVMAARHNIWTEEGSLMVPSFQTGGTHFMVALPKTENELDQWILSEMQVLLKEFQEKMDSYQLSEAIKNVPKFIDNLNNWYLRRSRKRFWKAGMNDDKISGYETLHYVLLTLSKILAPFCPFFAEKLFQDLVGDDEKSVHLEFLSFPKEDWINESLNEKIKISREIVRLSAAIRARKKVKLRQPLAKLQFFVSGFDSNLLDLDILKQEANVKEIEILEADGLQKIAQKIVKVDARKVGRKFGKKMQELIKEGKAGNFKLLENGQIEIAGEILAADEYESQFLCDEKFDAENFGNLVVLLETEISETLKIEGASRELIRAIQEKRKSDGFEISDRIDITFETKSELLKSAFKQFHKQISAEVLAVSITEGVTNGESLDVDGESISLVISKNS